jgi:hypothetical protein
VANAQHVNIAPQACMDRRIHCRAFGCSECAWVFNPSDSVTGNSFDEVMRNFELQRDREFSSHVCSDHRRKTSAKS